MCMVDLGEGWRVPPVTTNPVARKPHKCGECARTIEPGERYEAVRGMDSNADRFETFKSCAHCVGAREWLSVVCHGWLFNAVGDDLFEHWDESMIHTLDLGRRIIGMRRRWRRRDGSMLPIPGPVDRASLDPELVPSYGL